MTTSRKLYEALAQAFAWENERKMLPPPTGRDIDLIDICETKRYLLAHKVADALEKDNPTFNRERFLEACEL